jgi:hypothetical protein
MNAMEEQQLRPIEGTDTGEVALVEQRFTNCAVGLIGYAPDSFVGVPVGSKQVGPEMSHDAVLGSGRNQLDHGQPVSDGIMIIGREYGTNFEGGSPTPAPPVGIDPPSTVHPEVSVQGEVVAEAEELVLAARNHLAYPNAGQIGRSQRWHPKLGSGQHTASKHLIQPLACSPDRVSLRHGLIVPSRANKLRSQSPYHHRNPGAERSPCLRQGETFGITKVMINPIRLLDCCPRPAFARGRRIGVAAGTNHNQRAVERTDAWQLLQLRLRVLRQHRT